MSQENDFVADVTLEELAQIFSGAETWAEVRSEWPDEPIQRFIPGTDSGTFDYFVEEVFEEDEEPILSASNLQLSIEIRFGGLDNWTKKVYYFCARETRAAVRWQRD